MNSHQDFTTGRSIDGIDGNEGGESALVNLP